MNASSLDFDFGAVYRFCSNFLCHKRQIALCSIFCFLCIACKAHTESATPYPIIDSHLLVDPGLVHFFWMDNDRVIFGGHEKKTMPSSGTQTSSSLGIYIWDTNSNNYTRYADIETKLWTLCFNHGYVYYTVNNPPDDRPELEDIRAGDFGSESRLPPTKEEYQRALKKCEGFPRVEVTPPARLVYELRPQDGYILVAEDNTAKRPPVNESNYNNAVKLYKPGQSQIISLPILAKEMDLDLLEYSEYKNVYVLYPLAWRNKSITDSTWPPPSGTMMKIYLISPDGNVETIDVPSEMSPITQVSVTRVGIFWSFFSPTAAGYTSGTFQWHDGLIRKMPAVTPVGVVSPDGCKVVSASQTEASSPATAVVMDVCKPQKG